MRTLFQAFTALLVAVSTPVLAASPPQLCQDDLGNDKQGDFNIGPDGLSIDNNTILLRGDGRLQLNTNLKKLDVENITFPFDQRVTISYVYESAGASHALGYMYMDDVKARKYANDQGELVDLNGNGILDLHEALYNLTPDSDTKLDHPYIGLARRCNKTFTSGGFTYNHPELAMTSGCGEDFYTHTDTSDARPVTQAFNPRADNITVDWVGKQMELGQHKVDGKWEDNIDDPKDLGEYDASDRGVFSHIPNLLEPKAAANGNLGMGRVVFQLVDDDSDTNVFRKLGPVADTSDDIGDLAGVPDYDVSMYDYSGLKRPSNPDEGITKYDRTVDLGMVAGGKEIIFFAVVFYDTRHNLDNGTVAPCLKRQPYTGVAKDDGKCLLHLKTSVHVFFSKATWNLDQNFKDVYDAKKKTTNTVVAERNIGCGYSESCKTSSNGCNFDDGTPGKACGWLDTATINRLKTTDYGKLVMPKERVEIIRPGTKADGTVTNASLDRMNFMPHVIVGAPTTDPFRWILGFEDLSGGGDRDFNDIVFMINKENGGGAKSNTVSSDVMTSSLGPDFTITKVRFRRQDDIAPYANPGPPPTGIRAGCSKAPCWTENPVGSNACTASGVPPTINYSIAVDCRVLDDKGAYQPNPNPAWIPVVFPTTTPPTQEVELDLLAMGVTGSQLCWKVDISSPNDRCVPIIDDVDIGYQAVRSGAYARSSPSTLGNVAIWGVNETPGQAWGTGWPNTAGTLPGPGIRAYDGTKDYSIRGRLYLQSLYNPEDPSKTAANERWEAGRVMAVALTSAADPLNRKLYTTDSSGNRAEVKNMAGDKNSVLFPDSLCNDFSEIDNRFKYDMNHDGRCGTPTIDKDDFPDKHIEGRENERDFLVDWLYGYENRQATGSDNVRRPWGMGGINLSTVAVAVPPYQDNWYQNAKPTERDLYRDNFMTPLDKRGTVAYVGTMTGALHAFDTGDFRNALRDGCIGWDQQRGYFEPKACGSASSPAAREYGTGEELFAYMPNMMLSQYRNQYVRFRGSATLPKPQIDASPTIANVDLGTKATWTDASITFDWKPSATASRNLGAKTVLVSASGKSNPTVFALDITRPDLPAQYPLPMWEFSLADSTVATEFGKDPSVVPPDNTGSRHAPSVARIAWNGSADKDRRWVAVVGTDYEPATKRAGAVFLLDMKTGKPLDLDTTADGKYAGVITFEEGVGIAAESPMLDLDRDGTYDVMYVPTTNGSIWRVNLKSVKKTNKRGNKVEKCLVAKTSLALKGQIPDSDLKYQQLFSNMAVKLMTTDKGPAVRFFLGTGDNPDQYTDGPPEADPKNPQFQYFMLGFEDTDPKSEKACKTLDPMWVQKLEKGEKLWGGVTISADSVYAATAVGAAADICNLSDTRNGSAYTADQLTGAIKRTVMDGHAISPPVVHDEHLFVLTATGKMKIKGSKKWNNKSGMSSIPRSQIMLWESMPDGRLPQ
ncbi:DUF4114 domain-containing protein [Corallococcus exiguus]|uniref:DUF4114 domain-containing protein n=1 Tax=Corallococcus exiguus TaxID=83462 RepID=UPI00155F93FE|nr:DUF4114 domain-containing protein [Corallococcus exiguus]NRD43440.1 DUF4114 domain-containing protein [Corallococcus exiguus]